MSVTEIRNLWTARIRALDTTIWPRDGRTPYRDEMMDFFVTTMIELMQKAQANYEQFCRRNSVPVSRSTQKTPEPETQAEERAAYEARKQKLQKWHT